MVCSNIKNWPIFVLSTFSKQVNLIIDSQLCTKQVKTTSNRPLPHSSDHTHTEEHLQLTHSTKKTHPSLKKIYNNNPDVWVKRREKKDEMELFPCIINFATVWRCLNKDLEPVSVKGERSPNSEVFVCGALPS